MRAYDLEGDSRSEHRTSAESMTTVNGRPSGAVSERLRSTLGIHSKVYETVGRTLLDPVQNGLGEIDRRLAVSGYFCGPVDDADTFSGNPCQC